MVRDDRKGECSDGYTRIGNLGVVWDTRKMD